MNLPSNSGSRSARCLVTALVLILVALVLAPARAEAQSACTAATPTKFEPNPPGVSRPGSLSPGSSALNIYHNAAGAPRMMNAETFGYSVLDLTNPASPAALKYDDFRVDPNSATTNTIPTHGDGQSYVATTAVSPDGQRIAFSMNGPADPPWHTLAGRSDGAEGFGMWGDFPMNRALGTAVQAVNGRYIAYAVSGSSNLTAADITSLPTDNSAFQSLNIPYDLTGLPGGYGLFLVGNYLVYTTTAGVLTVFDASNPGPAGSITSAYKSVSIPSLASDPNHRAPLNYTAAVDPGDSTTLWILIEVRAASGENSPSYGLVAVTKDGGGNLTATAMPGLFRIPSQTGESWSTAGNASSLVGLNGVLYVVMWAQRISPGTQYGFYATTASAWALSPPAGLPFQAVAASGFSLPSTNAVSYAAGGAAAYQYFPTGGAAYAIPLTCAPVNPKAVSSITAVNTSNNNSAILNNGSAWIGDQVTLTPAVVPSPSQQALVGGGNWGANGWNFDFDFHAGSTEDLGATPRIKFPDNAAFGSPTTPPSTIVLNGPCDPTAGGVPSTGNNCWASVLGNASTGGPDFTGAEAPGSSKPTTIAMEANNQYGSNGTATFTINWKVPAAKVAATTILTGAALVSTSDGHPATNNGYKWYFANPLMGAGALAHQGSCDGLNACVPADQGSSFYWLTVNYTGGFSTPDYDGVHANALTITPFVPAFTVNGSTTSPLTAVINLPLNLVNNSQRGLNESATYKYSLCTPAPGCPDNFVTWPAPGMPDTPGATGTISGITGTVDYALKIQANYTGTASGSVCWPDPTCATPFTVHAVNKPVATAQVTPNPVTAGNSVTLTCSAVGGTGTYNSWAWQSNGTQISTQNPYTFTATNPGSSDITYPVTCTATDSSPLTSDPSPVVNLVIHASPKPVVTASVNPTTIASTNSATFSCSATGGVPPYTYQWSGTFGTVSQQQQYTISGSQTANSSGSTQYQQLTCTVQDSAGQTGSNSATLAITSSAPSGGGSLTVSASVNPNPVSVGQAALFSCSASGGSGSYTYAWYAATGPAVSTQQYFTYTPTSAGSTTLTCSVSDGTHTAQATAYLTAVVAGPTCPSVDFKVYASNGTQLQAQQTQFGTIPMSATLGDNLAFSITSSGAATQFDWNFGDGSAHKSGPISDGSVTYTTHAYLSGGSFTATLRPNCSDGSWGAGMSYPIKVIGPTGQFSAVYDDASPITYTQVTAYKNIVFTAIDPTNLVDPGSYAWDFGDGATVSGLATATHAYIPGTWTTKLTVTKNGFPVTATLVLTVPAPPEPPKWVVPGMAYVLGQTAGTTWVSDVTIMNPSTSLTAKYSVAFLDARAPVTDYSQLAWTPISVPPLSVMQSANLLANQPFNQPIGAYGALMVRGDVAPLPPVITARTFNAGDPTKGTFGLSVPQSSVAGGVSTQAVAAASALIGLRQNDSAYTNIGLVNLHNDWATVELDFFDGLSAADLGTLTVQIDPYQSYQINKALLDGRFVPAAGYSASSNLYSVIVKVTQGTGVYPYATVIDLGTTDPIVVTPIASPSNTYRIPGIVRLTGANGELWRSRVTVANTSSASRKVHLVFSYQACDASGCSSLNSTTGDVNFAPGQTQSWDDFVSVWLTYFGKIPVSDATSYQNTFLDVSPGDANSDPLVVLGETYNATPAGHVGLQIPGYTPVDGASSTGAYKRLALTGLASTAAYRTNVSLFSLAGATGKWASIHVLSAQGTDLRDIPVLVDTNGFTQLSAGTLFGGLPGDLSRLSIVIDNVDAGATFGAYATIIDNTSGDATFVKATPVP